MKGSIYIALVFAFIALISAPFGVQAQDSAPGYIPIQGYLTDSSGVALDGTFNITFSLYDAEGATTALLGDLQSVDVADGYFTAYLGDGSLGVVDLAVFKDNSIIWLGIKVGSDDEATPRMQLATAPFAGFAQYAGDSLTLAGRADSDFASATHTHAYGDLTGIPSSFTPSSHTHDYATLTNIPASFPPSPHDHDALYYRQNVLNSSGTINTGTNPVDWTKLKSVPAGFADGTDNDTTYSAGAGIAIASNTISLSTTGCVSGEVWKYDGTKWDCLPDANGTGDQIRYVSLGPADFKIASAAYGYSLSCSSLANCQIPASSSGIIYIPTHVPSNGTITLVSCLVMDNDSTSGNQIDITIWDGSSSVASASSINSASSQNVIISSLSINPDELSRGNALQIEWKSGPSPSMYLYRCFVTYTATTY